MAAPVENKVKASTAAAAASGLALWALGHYVFKGAVPDVVASWVYVILPSLLTFGAGYLARHTVRAVDPPPVPRTPTTRVTWPETPPVTPPVQPTPPETPPAAA